MIRPPRSRSGASSHQRRHIASCARPWNPYRRTPRDVPAEAGSAYSAAMRGKDAAVWTYNPDASEKLAPGMTLVVLGSAEQVSQLRNATT